MENIQRFCGLPSNESFSVWDRSQNVFTNCFLWTVGSIISNCLFMVCCAYLFGVSQVPRRKTTKKETLLSEVLCILILFTNFLEVVLSYSLKQHHPPAYVLSRTLGVASWMLCLGVHVRTRAALTRRKINNKYILTFSLLILVSSSLAVYSIVTVISNSNDLHFEKWPVMYYGVFMSFLLHLCFVISCIGICFIKLKQTSYNRALPSLSGGSLSIQADFDDSGPLVESGGSSQGSYYEAYIKHKDQHTDIFLGQAEATKNVFSKLLFWWCNKLILKGYHNQLNTPEDLYTLPSSLDTGSIKERFSSMFRTQRHFSIFEELDNESISEYSGNRKKKPYKISILKTMNKAYGKKYYSLGILKFLVDCLGFAGPLLLNYLVRFMENKKVTVFYIYFSNSIKGFLTKFLKLNFCFINFWEGNLH